MTKRFLGLLTITAALALTACGGGGSDTEAVATPFYGTYSVNLKLTGNTCNIGDLQPESTVIQYVSQANRTISLSSGTLKFQGTVDSDNAGFTTANSQVIDGVEVISNMNYRAGSPAGTHSVQYIVTAGGCNITYSGTATKI